LKRRAHDGLRILDRTCKEFVVQSATKIGTVGPFGGWNILLGQTIRVALDLRPEVATRSLAEVKDLVLAWFSKWEGWESGGDLPELQAAVRNASTMDEVIEVLRDPAASVSQ